MTDDQERPADVTDSADKSASRATGISTGRIITWLLIAALAALTGLEARAKFGYDDTLLALEGLNIEASDSGVELAEIDQNISGWTSRHTAENGQVVIRWLSLLKDYEVRLQPEPGFENRIGGYETPDAGVMEIEAPTLLPPNGGVASGLPPNPSSAQVGGGGRPRGAPGRPPGAVKGSSGAVKGLSAPGRPDKSKSDKKATDK